MAIWGLVRHALGVDRTLQVFIEANGEYMIAPWGEMLESFMDSDRVGSDVSKEELLKDNQKLVPTVLVAYLTDPEGGKLQGRRYISGRAWAYGPDGSLAFHVHLQAEPRTKAA